MHLAALLIGLIACAGIIVLGIRFLLQPRQATLDFGVAADNLRALTEIKGARDITSSAPSSRWPANRDKSAGPPRDEPERPAPARARRCRCPASRR
jgi:hypothetical protein